MALSSTRQPIALSDSVIVRLLLADFGRFGAGDGCDAALNDRLTISLVIGAVGLAAFFGASQVKNREDD